MCPFKKIPWWTLFEVQMMAVPWEKECFLLSSQRPLMATLWDSDALTRFEIWWKWQVSMGNVDSIPISITLFGSVYLSPFSFPAFKALVSSSFLSSIQFIQQCALLCARNSHFPSASYLLCCLIQCQQTALFINAVTQINI